MLSHLSVSLVALFSLVAVVVANPPGVSELRGINARATGRKCGSEPTPEAVTQNENAFAAILAQNPLATSSGGSFTVQVIFNVIYASENIADGYIPESQIDDQIKVLNEDYSGTGLSFNLKETVWTPNADWFNNVAPENARQTAMKEELRQGNAQTLNVYTVGFNNDASRGLLGYATFPADYQNNPKDDGVVLHYATLPGGSQAPYDLGRTLTHEVGHWVGLYHPFMGGCDGPNDYVKDTPSEAEPAEGCPASRNTCPDRSGTDPVHNFMDYANDPCMTEFTPGQIDRLQSQIRSFRDIDL